MSLLVSACRCSLSCSLSFPLSCFSSQRVGVGVGVCCRHVCLCQYWCVCIDASMHAQKQCAQSCVGLLRLSLTLVFTTGNANKLKMAKARAAKAEKSAMRRKMQQHQQGTAASAEGNASGSARAAAQVSLPPQPHENGVAISSDGPMALANGHHLRSGPAPDDSATADSAPEEEAGPAGAEVSSFAPQAAQQQGEEGKQDGKGALPLPPAIPAASAGPVDRSAAAQQLQQEEASVQAHPPASTASVQLQPVSAPQGADAGFCSQAGNTMAANASVLSQLSAQGLLPQNRMAPLPFFGGQHANSQPR